MTEQSFSHIDKRQLRRAFEKAAQAYDSAAVLQHEVGRRMLERLSLIKKKPQVILDLGAGTGHATKALLKRHRHSTVIAVDIAPAMLKKASQRCGVFRRPALICADIEALPIHDASADLIYSNLTLQWCNDINKTFQEFRRVTKAGGLLMFTTFGPDTLKELRASWASVDNNFHVHAFLDMHDLGDTLVRAGYADPVLDMEMLTMTYRDVTLLMQDLKLIGAQNKSWGRPRGLTSKTNFKRFLKAYEAYRTPDGLYPASYEVVYGHAWVAESATLFQSGTHPADFRIPIDQVRRH
jgi:malonyl-CoA O-methyltransferase